MYQNQFINFTKGLAILVVFFLHCSITYADIHKNVVLPLYGFTPAWTGVWIFFIISGYLIGKGFWNERYKVDKIRDFKDFYIKRAERILPVYFLIVFIDMFFINTNMYFNGSETLLRVFTFRLRNSFGNNMIGNLWFVSTIIQLYFVTPFIFKYLLKPLKNFLSYKKIFFVIFVFLIVLGFAERNILWNAGVSWNDFIYVNSLCNIDLFFASFIFSIFCLSNNDNKIKKVLRPISLCSLIIFLIINTILMFLSSYNYISSSFIKIACPTLVLLITLLCLYSFDIESSYYSIGNNIKERVIKVLKNPFLVINYLGIISFELFCCHCQIIYQISQINNSSLTYNEVVLISFILNLIWAVVLHILLKNFKLKKI